jgi:isopentenyldiphosphate isomerase
MIADLHTTVDYILFAVADVDVVPNPEEVQAVRYVDAEELTGMLEGGRVAFTPWFKLVAEGGLFRWWKEQEVEVGEVRTVEKLEALVGRREILSL